MELTDLTHTVCLAGIGAEKPHYLGLEGRVRVTYLSTVSV